MSYEDRVKEMAWREAIDRQTLRGLQRAAFNKRLTQKIEPFSDVPIVISKDSILYETYDQMIYDSLNGSLPTSQTAGIGQYWVEYDSKAKGMIVKAPKDDSFYTSFSHTTERVNSAVEEKEKVVIVDGYKIWRIELPTHLFPIFIQCPSCNQVFTIESYKTYPDHWKINHEKAFGQTPLKLKCLWKSERWRPQVFKGIWKDANDFECENWSRIPIDSKRINFCVGLIEDDTSEE